MTDQRFIIEMGMGNDAQDYTRAAARAIEDAMARSTLPMITALRIDPSTLRVQVTIGVAQPDALDLRALQDMLPHEKTTLHATPGGLDITDPDTGEITVIATAAIEFFLPQQT